MPVPQHSGNEAARNEERKTDPITAGARPGAKHAETAKDAVRPGPVTLVDATEDTDALAFVAKYFPIQEPLPRRGGRLRALLRMSELRQRGPALILMAASVAVLAGLALVLLRGQKLIARRLPASAPAAVSEKVRLDRGGAAAAPAATISVATDPSEAAVTVDGHPHGTSPVTVDDLSPGDHRVTVWGVTGSAERTVTLAAGATMSLVFSLPRVAAPASPSAGWLSVSAPFDTEVVENNELLGTSRTSRIMLPTGRHQINLINQALAYRETRAAEIVAGRTTTLRINPPKAALNANARPWAEVAIDGNVIGQTPLAGVPVAIGAHDVLFRHPTLGERRETVIVTTGGPNRVSVDFLQ